MYTYPWYHWITFFYIYCFCGWIFESTYVSLKSRRFVNRGFLRLPMLPLYGTGAVMMLWASLPFKDNIVLVYLSGVVAATLLEYVTGYAMERLFKMKYWDYSSQRFNLHGYICLSSSIAWGFLTIFLTDVIHRPIADFVLNMNPVFEFTLIAIVSVLFVSDAVKSTKEALDLGRALEAMTKMRAEVEELQLQLALLKAETAQKMAELSELSLEDAAQKVAGSITDSLEEAAQHVTASLEEAVQRVADMREETVQRIADIREETVQRMADMREETAQRVADMREETAQRVADMREETAQRMADMREETAQHVSELKEGTSHRVTGLREGTSQRMAAAAQKLKEHTDREYDLSERLTALSEKRLNLSRHMTFYRKGILRGNPSASSKRFAGALKELKEMIDSKRSD